MQVKSKVELKLNVVNNKKWKSILGNSEGCCFTFTLTYFFYYKTQI